jgi:hypothetical protein
MKDLTVILEDRPGGLADLGEATGSASINIEGVCGTQEGGGALRILVDDEAAARSALADAGFEVGRRARRTRRRRRGPARQHGRGRAPDRRRRRQQVPRAGRHAQRLAAPLRHAHPQPPRLAVAPSGEALLSWVPSAPDTADLRYATRPPGGPFGAAQVVAGVAPAGDFHGGPAALGDGTFLEPYTTANRVRVIARPPAATFDPTPELDTGGSYPLVVAAGRRAVAAWVVAKGDAVRLVASPRTA